LAGGARFEAILDFWVADSSWGSKDRGFEPFVVISVDGVNSETRKSKISSSVMTNWNGMIQPYEPPRR